MGGAPTFAACPLPLLTHPCGAYLKAVATFDDAFARARHAETARLVVVHTNFIKGQVAKTNAMRGLGFWSPPRTHRCR